MKHFLLILISALLLLGCDKSSTSNQKETAVGNYVSDSPLVHDLNITLDENGFFTLITKENSETVSGNWLIKDDVIELNPKKIIRLYEELKKSGQLKDDQTFSLGFGEVQTGIWEKKGDLVHLNIQKGGEVIKFKYEKNQLIMIEQLADIKLIKKGSQKLKSNFSKLDYEEVLAIASAVTLGNLAKVKLAVESGLSPNTSVGAMGNKMPMLNWASMGKNTELIKYLIEKGADVNSKNKLGVEEVLKINWLESAYFVKENGLLKIKFLHSQEISKELKAEGK